MDTLIRLLAVAALILLNAFFVATEFALVSVRRSRVEQLVAEGSRAAGLLMRAKDDPNRYISAAQLGITIASLALGWLGEETIAAVVQGVFHNLALHVDEVTVHTIAVAISFALITFLHIVLGEQVPKMLALHASERVALLTVGPTEAFYRAFFPFITLLAGTTDAVLRLLGIGRGAEHGAAVHSPEELEFLIQASHQAGKIQDIERQLLSEVFDFGELTVAQVMVPRNEMMALSVDATFQEVLDRAASSPHTRFPVFEGTIDNVIGTIHLREVLLASAQGPERFNLRAILHPPLLIPESALVEVALREFRQAEARVAIVFDEYGGTAGLVTFEDLVSEIFGRIGDEFRHEEPEIRQQPDGTALINPRVLLDEFDDRFGQHLTSEEVDTLGGYVLEQLGRMAKPNDVVEVKDGTIRVEAVDGVRILELRFVPNAPRERTNDAPLHTDGSEP